jgi:hypothetical protein
VPLLLDVNVLNSIRVTGSYLLALARVAAALPTLIPLHSTPWPLT